MRKGDATRLRILDEATRQASVRGLAGISLADIAAPSGLTKSGLFKHFDSKEAMQRAVLESAFDRFVESVWTASEDLPAGRPRLEAVFDRWLDWCFQGNASGGCPLNAMAVELDDQPGPLRDYLRERQLGWRRYLVEDFKALSDPPLDDADAWQAVFEMKGNILGYSEASRLLEDGRARTQAKSAFARLLERLENHVTH